MKPPVIDVVRLQWVAFEDLLLFCVNNKRDEEALTRTNKFTYTKHSHRILLIFLRQNDFVETADYIEMHERSV